MTRGQTVNNVLPIFKVETCSFFRNLLSDTGAGKGILKIDNENIYKYKYFVLRK